VEPLLKDTPEMRTLKLTESQFYLNALPPEIRIGKYCLNGVCIREVPL